MKKILLILIALTISPAVAFAAPEVRYERTLLPTETNTYELGTSSLRWLNIFGKNGFFENITVTGTCTGCGGGGGGGGISSSTNPLMATYFVATSTTATSTFPNINISTALSIFGNYVNSLTGLKSLINYWTLSGSNLTYTTGNIGIGTTTPGTTLGVQGRGLFSNDVVASNFTATSTTATSTFPKINTTYFQIGNDTINDITGSGLTVVGGALTATGGGSGPATSTNPLMGTYIVATSTTATSSLPQLSSSVITSLWGSFTRLFVSGLSSSVGQYVVVGANGELLATTTPQMTTIVPISGTRNDTNTTFTTASEPILVVINGQAWAGTGGAITWTYSGGTITTSQPVGTGGDIYGLSLGVGLIAMVSDPYTFYVPTISGDATTVLQAYINRASAYATSTGNIATLKFPATSYSTDELVVQEDTVWDCNNTSFLKRNDASGGLNGSLIRTNRYSSGGSYYGHNDNISFKGCTFSSNNKTLTQAIFRMLDVYNMQMEDLTFRHTPGGLQLATNICGRVIRGNNLRVVGGETTLQDGFHITCGDSMTFTNLVCDQSGDDCVALGRDIAGPSGVGEDEGISNVTINGLVCNSIKGRCVTFYAGHDFIDSGFLNVRKIKNVIVNGAVGKCGQIRSFCLGIIDEMDYGQIFSYTINSGGTGYTSGTYLSQATTGGGCTSQPLADVIITGGVITSVKPANLGGGTFSVGDGCTSGPTLSLTGLGAGVGANVTGDMVVIDPTVISNISFQGKLTAGTTTATHDGTQAYGMYVVTGDKVKIDVDMTFASTTENRRPWIIYCGNNYDVKWTQTGTTTYGGYISPTTWNCEADNWNWHDSLFQSFDGAANPGEGVFYFRSGTLNNWSVTNSKFNDLTGGAPAFAWNSAATTSSLSIINNKLYELTGAVNSRGLNQQSCVNCSEKLIMIGNDFSQIDIPINGATAFQNSNSSYLIRDNLGIKTNYCQQPTIGAGATTTTVTVGALTGLTSSTALGLGSIKVNPITSIVATSTIGTRAVSTTTYDIIVPYPLPSTQTFMSCEDTSKKQQN